MSSQAATEKLCRQAWSLQNQMEQQGERQIFCSELHIPQEGQSKIKSYLREDPWIYSHDGRDRLIQEGIYDEIAAPNLCGISQSMQEHFPENVPFRDESREDTFRPIQNIEQLASRDVTGSCQDSRMHVAQQQSANSAQQQWFAHQQMLSLHRQQTRRWFEQQHELMLAQLKQQAAAAKISTTRDRRFRRLCDHRRSDKPLKTEDRVGPNEGKSGVNFLANSSFLWSTLEELYPTKRRTTSRMMKMMRNSNLTADCSSAAESILASGAEKQEHAIDVESLSQKISLKDEKSTAELKSKDERLFQIEIKRHVGELSSAVDELRLQTTQLEREKSRLEREVQYLKSQLYQQRLDSSDSSQDDDSEASDSISDDVLSLRRYKKALTLLASRSSPSSITSEKRNSKKSLDKRVDQLTASVERMQKTLDRLVTLYEPEKLQTFDQREDQEKSEEASAATKDREDELKILRSELGNLETQRIMEEVKYIRVKLEWEIERDALQKKLQHYESISQKHPTNTSSAQTTPAEQTEPDEQEIQEHVATSLQDTIVNVEEPAKCLQDTRRISEQNESLSTSSSAAHELKAQTITSPTDPIVKGREKENLRQQFMSLLLKHSCKNLDCSVTKFEKIMKHASKCTKVTDCNWYICKMVHARSEHLKVCGDNLQCELCQPFNYIDEDSLQEMMIFLNNICLANQQTSDILKERMMYIVVRRAVNYDLVGDVDGTADGQLSASSCSDEERLLAEYEIVDFSSFDIESGETIINGNVSSVFKWVNFES